MLVGSHVRLSTLDTIIISVDNNHLDEVQSFPYLGLVIDKNLTWDGHVEYMRRKINNQETRYCLPLSAKIVFFNFFVLPFFDYGDVNWGDRRLFFLSQLQPSFLKSHGFAARRSHAPTPLSLNLKKTRDCSQSTPIRHSET